MFEDSDGEGEGASEWDASVPKIRDLVIGRKLSLIDGNTKLPWYWEFQV